jgi:pilus assembly protein CpaB
VSRRRRALILAGIALLLGAIAASDVAGREAELEQRVGSPVKVVVAIKPIGRGQTIEAAMLALRELPKKFAPEQSFAGAEQLIGARAAVAIAAGVDLQPALLQGADAGVDGALLAAGANERLSRVIAVGDAGEITPGSRVDLLITRDTANGSATTRIGLRDAEVVEASPAAAVAEGSSAGLPRVALALRVSLQQAVLLAEAQSAARELRALPRPPAAKR